MRRVPREPSPDLPPPPVQQPPPTHESSDEDLPQYVTPAPVVQSSARLVSQHNNYAEYDEAPQLNQPKSSYTQQPKQSPPSAQLADRDRLDRVSDPAKLPFSQRVNLFKQSQNDQPRQDYKNYIKYVILS